MDTQLKPQLHKHIVMHSACPSNDYTEGEPSGKCWGDGHYMCNTCKWLRADFKGEDWKKRDALLAGQGGIQITVL